MPTGGVDTTKENLEAWFKSGVCAVGMGSKLISKKLMEQKDYAAIEELTKVVLHTIQIHKKINIATSHRKIQMDNLCPVVFCHHCQLFRRQVLSLLQPYLADPKKFNWSNTDYANITAVFQFVYALSMLFCRPNH
jgi:hypothetical protein